MICLRIKCPVFAENELSLRYFQIPPSGSFGYADRTVSGGSLPPGGTYTGYNVITVFDGVEVRTVNSTSSTQMFEGPGLLLLPKDSNTAFYTTYAPSINDLIQSIDILKNFLFFPQIKPGEGSITTSDRSVTVDFGTDVTVYEGADVIIECNVIAGSPEPTTNFYRVISEGDRVQLNTTDEVTVANTSLTLQNVQMDDVGEYVCVANNGVPPAATVSSTLQVLPAGQCVVL